MPIKRFCQCPPTIFAHFVPVAQLYRAPLCEGGGHWLKSSRERHFNGGLAQMPRAPRLHRGGRSTSRCIPYHFACVAQLAERRIRNAQVVGSSPATGSSSLMVALV